MKQFYGIFLLTLVLLPVWAKAQVNNQGEIIYEEVINMKFEMTEEQQARLKQMNIELPSSFSSEKSLIFTSKEAIYKQIPKEETPDANGNNGMRMRFNRNNDNILYQDLEKDEVLEQREFMTRKFLIEGEEDEKKPQWKITGEQKEILGYPCQKAILNIEPKDSTKQGMWGSQETSVEAWFTMQIPVSLGPEKYKGLPGLILELTTDFTARRTTGKRTITATKVDLKELNEGSIEKPNKGKKVSREEYQEIVREKMEEMRENRGGRGNRMIVR